MEILTFIGLLVLVLIFFTGGGILDLMLASNGKDIEVYTDRYVYVKMYSGGIRKK